LARARWNSFIQFLCEVYQTPPQEHQRLVDELLSTGDDWPWVERGKATFVYESTTAQHVALNIDIVNRDPPFEHMVQLEGTSLWYFQRYFERDALLDYMFAVDDPGTPLAQDLDLGRRVERYWRADARNTRSISSNQLRASVLQMPRARPFADWARMRAVPRGRVHMHKMHSAQMGFPSRSLWVYLPPGFSAGDGKRLRLLLVLDGQWAMHILQLPYIVDALIKHGKIQPIAVAMLASGTDDRSSDRYYPMLTSELMPLLAAQHKLEPPALAIAGMSESALAAADVALKNPALYRYLLLLSPPLGAPQHRKLVQTIRQRLQDSPQLPRRIFQAVGRYENEQRFYQPALQLRDILQRRMQYDADLDYRFVELGSGHSLAAFKSILPEAIAHAFSA